MTSPPLAKPDIVSVLEGEGIDLRRRGRDYWAKCPLHADKTPSFTVSPERQRWHCFGCNEGGDVLDFIQKHHGITFKDALIHLAIKPGLPVKVDPQRSRRRELQKQFEGAITSLYRNLCDEATTLHDLRIKVKMNPGSLTETKAFLFAAAMSRLGQVDYQIDTLWDGTVEDKISLLKENRNANRAAA